MTLTLGNAASTKRFQRMAMLRARSRAALGAVVGIGLGGAAGLQLGEVPKAFAQQSVIAFVNDEPISGFDLQQRVNFMMLSSDAWRANLQQQLRGKDIQERFKAYAQKRNPKSREEVKELQKQFVEELKANAQRGARAGLSDRAMRELINERLQIQEAKRFDLNVGDEEVDEAIAVIAKRNEKGPKEFEASLKSAGVNIYTMREKIRAQIAWQRLVSRRYGNQVSVSVGELDSALATIANDGESAPANQVEYQLQRITFAVSGNDQAQMASRLDQADQLRRSFKSCNETSALAGKAKGAKFENLGNVRGTALPAEARPMLVNTKNGDMTPPVLTAAGVELYAVCGRRETRVDSEKRAEAQQKLRSEKLAALSDRLMRNICQEAYIVYREGAPKGRRCGTD